MLDVPLSRTPDFYTYSPAALDAAALHDGVVRLQWSDGREHPVYALWLWENRVGDVAIEERTREAKLDPADLPDHDVLRSVTVDQRGDLVAEWADGTSSIHDCGWLRHVADGRHLPADPVPAPVEWTTADHAVPVTHGPAALDDDAALLEFLLDLARYGLARLEGLPTGDHVVPALAARIGALRDTNFGTTWPVKVDVAPTSTANTALPLPPHTDLPTRETPPGFQMLHCQVNTCDAGESTMADGYAVAHHLAEHEPDHHEALCTLPWVFFNRSPRHDHRWSGPIIDRGAPGTPLTLRAFHPVRAFPDMAIEDQPRAYAALRVFSRTASDPHFQMRYPFRPGDLVMFDNRRILHGRRAIDGGGRRELHGAYLDHDEVYSRLRVLSRRRANATDIVP